MILISRENSERSNSGLYAVIALPGWPVPRVRNVASKSGCKLC